MAVGARNILNISEKNSGILKPPLKWTQEEAQENK